MRRINALRGDETRLDGGRYLARPIDLAAILGKRLSANEPKKTGGVGPEKDIGTAGIVTSVRSQSFHV